MKLRWPWKKRNNKEAETPVLTKFGSYTKLVFKNNITDQIMVMKSKNNYGLGWEDYVSGRIAIYQYLSKDQSKDSTVVFSILTGHSLVGFKICFFKINPADEKEEETGSSFYGHCFPSKKDKTAN